MTDTAYIAPSTLDTSGRPELSLATALGRTPTGDVWHPTFFTGFVARPDVAAAAMLAVADVAATRYADLGLAKRLANLDPVVTASGDRLRFESFSQCNGVHARFDLEPDGIDAGEVGFGTTNVDINPPLRAALASVPRGELLHLSVGSDALRVATPDTAHEERKVPLPDRWVRGFAETPLLARATEPVLELHGRAIATFLGELPRISSGPGPELHLMPGPGGIRVVPHALPGSLPLPGSRRLESARRIVRFATRMTASSSPKGTTAWRFEVPGGVLTLLLTPGAYRGFSGEGSLLELLTHPDAESVGRSLLTHLAWEPLVDPDGLAAASGHARSRGRRRPRLAVGLGAAGLRHHGRRLVPPGAPGGLRPDRARQPAAAVGPQDHRHRARRRRLADAGRRDGRRPDRPARPARRRPVGVHVSVGGGAPRHPRAVQARPRGGAGPAGRHLRPVEDTPDRRVARGVGGLVFNLY